MTAAEVHSALRPWSAAARQLKKVALGRGHATLILRNEAKPSDGPPVHRALAARVRACLERPRSRANRTDFDLKQHAKFSGKALNYFDDERKEHVVPYVIEPSAGVDRALLAFLADAYREEEVRGEKRVVLRFHPELAPVKVAVLPLLKKREDIVRTVHAIRDELSKEWTVVYDDTAAIGRLYRRQDEVGTPYCVTVDVQTVGDQAKGEVGDGKVTIRDRDSMEQIRVPLTALGSVFRELLGGGAWASVASRFERKGEG